MGYGPLLIKNPAASVVFSGSSVYRPAPLATVHASKAHANPERTRKRKDSVLKNGSEEPLKERLLLFRIYNYEIAKTCNLQIAMN